MTTPFIQVAGLNKRYRVGSQDIHVLRDLDLTRRLLKYPLSYLIYSEGFDGLPPSVKAYVSRRLTAILTGADTSRDFSSLRPEDRKAILEILEDTKPELITPDPYFSGATTRPARRFSPVPRP